MRLFGVAECRQHTEYPYPGTGSLPVLEVSRYWKSLSGTGSLSQRLAAICLLGVSCQSSFAALGSITMNDHLLNDALQLTVLDRLELIEKLWDSLSQSDLPVTDAEKQFLDQRIVDMNANPGAQSSWQDARARLVKRRP